MVRSVLSRLALPKRFSAFSIIFGSILRLFPFDIGDIFEKSQKSNFFFRPLSVYMLGAAVSLNDTNSVVSVIDGNCFPSATKEAGRRLRFGLPLGVDSFELNVYKNEKIHPNTDLSHTHHSSLQLKI